MRWKAMTVGGWGRNGVAEAETARPEQVTQAQSALGDKAENGVVARGAGRSYGDPACNDGGRVILSERLNRILEFDETSGDVVLEPGVTFRDLLDVFLPRGFLTPVSPGTAYATIGGAVANDVHGKNHEAVGSIGHHVKWIELLLPSGETVRTSADERPDLFDATIGGIGLTGMILSLCLTLSRIPSNAVERHERRIPNLEAFLQAFDEAPKNGMDYSVGWIDGFGRGAGLGRGIFEHAKPAADDVSAPPARRRAVPFDFPGFALNSLSVRAFNTYYFRRIPVEGRSATVPYEALLYPLDAVLDWNRIYGKRGFHQFQCVIPRAQGEPGLRKLLEEIRASRRASFLAVLKAMGKEGRGCLSFPMEGYTLAMDFPNKRGVAEFLGRLERITLDHGGRIYLAKDSCVSPDGFAAMYPRLDEFRSVLADIDPDRRMDSSMARRLNIRKGA